MTTHTDSNEISKLISDTTKKIISDTESFLSSVADVPVGEDTVTLIINKKLYTINASDYEKLKAINDATKSEMKAEIKSKYEEFKQHMKNNSQK